MNNPYMSEETCVNTMKLLGDYWTLRIIDALDCEEIRFCDLQRRLDNLNPVTLTNRLKKLEADDLVNRREEAMDKISVISSMSAAYTAIMNGFCARQNTVGFSTMQRLRRVESQKADK